MTVKIPPPNNPRCELSTFFGPFFNFGSITRPKYYNMFVREYIWKPVAVRAESLGYSPTRLRLD